MENTQEIVMTKADLDQVVKEASEKAVASALKNATPAMFGGNATITVGKNRAEKVEQAQHLGKFLKAAMTFDQANVEKVRADAPHFYTSIGKVSNLLEGSSAPGGYIVPTFWSEEIYTGVEKYGFARKLCKMFPMQTLTHYLNQGGAVTGGFTAEGSAPTVLDATSFFSQTPLTAKRLTAAFITSRQLLDDATPAYMDFMTAELSRFLAQEEDKALFNGSGSGANPTGIIGTSGVNVKYQGNSSSSGKTTRANISWRDLMYVRNSMNTSLTANAVFVACQTSFGALCTELAGVSGSVQPVGALTSLFQPIEVPDAGIGAAQANQYMTPTGKRLYVVPDSCFPTDAVTTACIIYGDFSQYALFGTRSDAEVQTFKESYGGTSIGGTNQWAIEIQERVGFAFPVASAFTLLKTSTT